MNETLIKVAGNDELKKRAINLFSFLREAVGLRTKVVRDLDSYTTVIWLANIPKEPECKCITWDSRPGDDREGPWLEIKKPRLQRPPKLPGLVEPWMNPHDLADSSKEPILYKYKQPLTDPADTGGDGGRW